MNFWCVFLTVVLFTFPAVAEEVAFSVANKYGHPPPRDIAVADIQFPLNRDSACAVAKAALLQDKCDTIQTFDEIPVKDQGLYIKEYGKKFDWLVSRGMVGVTLINEKERSVFCYMTYE